MLPQQQLKECDAATSPATKESPYLQIVQFKTPHNSASTKIALRPGFAFRLGPVAFPNSHLHHNCVFETHVATNATTPILCRLTDQAFELHRLDATSGNAPILCRLTDQAFELHRLDATSAKAPVLCRLTEQAIELHRLDATSANAPVLCRLTDRTYSGYSVHQPPSERTPAFRDTSDGKPRAFCHKRKIETFLRR